MILVLEAREEDVRALWDHPLYVLRYCGERGSLPARAVLWRRYRIRVEDRRAS